MPTMVAVARDLEQAPAHRHSQRLLGTLLGDYWFWRPEPLPSAALVEIMGEFGLAEQAARAAMRRAAARGAVVATRSGRTTAYGVPARTRETIVAHLTRLMRFGAGDRQWDGRWTIALFTVPEEERETRRAVRTRLRWLGLAPLYDGAWVSPWEVGDRVAAVLADLGVAAATVVRAEMLAAGPAGEPVAAWDLAELRGRYTAFLAEYAALRERVRAGEVGPAEALVARTHLMTAWRAFPDADPELPAALLPADWPLPAARSVFVEIYDGLGPLAEQRFAQLVGRHDPALAALAAHRTSADIRRGESATAIPAGDAPWIGPIGE
jgi:phenylacetic acid degradation operon negative regulatory protein